VINGTKTFITNGGYAGVYTVFAMTDPDAGARGMSCFMVERDRPGVSIGNKEDKLGIRTSDTVEVYFDNVRIPAANLVGQESKGFKIAMTTFDHTRPAAVGAGCVGAMRFLIDQCVEYAKTRVTFGQQILMNQAIQFKIARMEMKCQAARALVYRAANMLDNKVVDTVLCSSTKVIASDALMECAAEAIQIFGGNGYSNEYPIAAVYRDAKIFQIFEGTNEILHMASIKAIVKDSMPEGSF
jgi:alkylation response protein AidB-like acyl-CoA dehydrogenase